MSRDGNFSKLGASAADLQLAFEDRLKDAEALLKADRNASSMAAGLYAVEILLKTRICRILKLGHLPKAFEFHDIFGLATSAGLRQQTEDPAFVSSGLGANWSKLIVHADKLEELRYQPDSKQSRNEAEEFWKALVDPNEGVVPWIQRQP